MFGIKIKNIFLDLYPDTNFSFEQTNAAYLGDGIDIDNGMIFAVKIPLRGANAKTLGYPHLPDNAGRFLKNAPCEIYKNGRLIFYAGLTVIKAETTLLDPSCEVSIVINTLSKFKDMPMNELDLGTLDIFNSDILTHATDTCTNPHLYNYIFYQVHNPDFYGSKSNVAWTPDEFQNFWNRNGSPQAMGNISISGGGSLTPHLKISFILKKIFETVGFTLINNWQTDDELKLLTLYNNASISRPDGLLSDQIYPLSKGLPNMKVSEFLALLCRKFCLSFSINFFTKKAVLSSFGDILNKNVKQSWTLYLISDATLTQKNNFPLSLKDKKGSDSIVPDLASVVRFNSPLNIDTDPTGLYRNGDNWEYHETETEARKVARALVYLADETRLDGDENSWELDIGNLAMTQFRLETAYSTVVVPAIKQHGTYEKWNVERQADDVERHPPPPRLLFYRGFYQYRDGSPNSRNYPVVPLATAETEGFDGHRVTRGIDAPNFLGNIPLPVQIQPKPTQHSLLWFGEHSLARRAWLKVTDFLKSKRDVTVRVDLPLDKLLTFNFDDKIEIGNQHCFIKKMSGILQAEGDMIELELALVTIL